MSKVQRDPAPTTFRERLLAHEHQRHAARLAEIKEAEARLRALEPTIATLQARGISLWCDSTLGNYWKSLTLTCGTLTEWDNKIYDALVDLGFTEIDRYTGGPYAHCTLKQGRNKVRVSIMADHKPAPNAAAAAPAIGGNHAD
jgi:hypothetical protein